MTHATRAVESAPSARIAARSMTTPPDGCRRARRPTADRAASLAAAVRLVATASMSRSHAALRASSRAASPLSTASGSSGPEQRGQSPTADALAALYAEAPHLGHL